MLLVVILLGSGAVHALSLKTVPTEKKSSGLETNVVLTDEGYTPGEITIRSGQSVKFTTTRGKIFWPASDYHPVHDLYPEFDPKIPIDGDKAWSFTFTKIGTWHYHDHLAPYYTGTIKVTNAQSNDSSTVVSEACQGSAEKPPVDCWNKKIKTALSQGGINQAFDLLGNLYRSDPIFPENCHNFAHDIGYEVYRQFAQDKNLKFKVTTATSYCGYGFYHGFMTRLFGSGKDTKLARDFCSYVDKSLSQDSPDISGSCYHGIGHGAVVDPDKSLWGNAPGLVDHTAQMCRSLVPDTDDELNNCYNGLFNGLGTLYTKNQYGFNLDQIRKDPYMLCRGVSDELKNSCYLGMYIAALWSANHDLVKVAEFVETIPEDRFAETAMRQLAANIAYKDINKADHSDLVLVCRGLVPRLRLPCLSGSIKALTAAAEPGKEYNQLSICQLAILQVGEREVCYDSEFQLFNNIYSSDKVDQICQTIAQDFRKFCRKNI